jgi:hypothetical protein
MEAYVIGSSEKLEISADIKNAGEDAFNAMLYLQIPRGVNYINANTRLANKNNNKPFIALKGTYYIRDISTK